MEVYKRSKQYYILVPLLDIYYLNIKASRLTINLTY